MSKLTKYLGIDRLVDQKAADLARRVQQSMLQIGFNNVVYANGDTATLVEKAFENIIYFSVADRIAEKFGHIARYCYKEDGKKSMKRKAMEDNMVEGELSKLLQRPNNYQGQDSFFYLIGLSYKTCGEAFIWKNRGGIENGKPVELYVLPPWLISIKRDETLFGVEEYILQVGGHRIPIPAQDMIHWKKPALALSIYDNEHLRGYNPLIPSKKTVQESNDIQDASTSMMQNQGVRAIIYNETLDSLDPQQQDRLKSVVDGKFNNNTTKSAIAAIQGKWGALDLSKGAVDMQLIEADEKVTKKICFSLGFPPELYQSDSTFANKEQAWLFFITNTLMPMCASFDGELNRSLLPDFKEGGFVSSDFNDLPEMAQIRTKSAQALKDEWMITPNEKRIALGYEPINMPEMDKVYIPSGNTPIDEATVGQGMDNADTQDYNG